MSDISFKQSFFFEKNMVSKRKHRSKKNATNNRKRITLEISEISEISKELTKDAQNPSNFNSTQSTKSKRPRKKNKNNKNKKNKRDRQDFNNRSNKDDVDMKEISIKREDEIIVTHTLNKSTKAISCSYDKIKHEHEVKIEKSLTENITSIATTSFIKDNKLQSNINKIFQPIKKGHSVTSGYSFGSETRSEIKHEFPKTEPNTCNLDSTKEPFIYTNNDKGIKTENDQTVSETLASGITICKDSKVKILPASCTDFEKMDVVDANKPASDKISVNIVNTYGPSHDVSDCLLACTFHIEKKSAKHPLAETITPRSSQDENKHYLSAPRSALGDIITEDNDHSDPSQNQKNENLQNLYQNNIPGSQFNKKQVLPDRCKKTSKFQLLRPEELRRNEFWHSYANESRSPNYVLCRFQKSLLKSGSSKKNPVKKVRFYKFVEVEKAIDITEYRKSNKIQNQAVNIWFSGTTGINTQNNKKPERNPVTTNIDLEDRTCDIHVSDLFYL